jgi:hypothetical protein
MAACMRGASREDSATPKVVNRGATLLCRSTGQFVGAAPLHLAPRIPQLPSSCRSHVESADTANTRAF